MPSWPSSRLTPTIPSQANNVKVLAGSRRMRLRVGDFRVIFEEDADVIVVLDIGPRGGIYE